MYQLRLFYCGITLSIVACHVHHARTHISQLLSDPDHSHEFTPAPQRSTFEADDDGCKRPARCVPFVQCPAHFTGGHPPHCHLIGGREGVCCTTGQKHKDPASAKSRSEKLIVSKDMLNAAASQSKGQVNELLLRESRLLMSGRSAIVAEGSPSHGHYRNFRLSHPGELSQIMTLSHRALEVTLATRALKERESYSVEDLEMEELMSDLRSSPLGAACAAPPLCPKEADRFRSVDGSCNNVMEPSWGVALTPYTRLLPPSYADGIWTPRTSKVHGQPLPSPRLISSTLFTDVNRPDKEHTLMLMQFGQFLSHDFSRTVTSRYANGSGISCCTADGVHELPMEMRHYACMPITVSPQDGFYHQFSQRCMNFVRSVLAPRQECNLGYSQQMNRVSHFIDGSAIYGSDESTLNELREYTGGRLRMFNDYGRDLLPLSKNAEDCLTMEQGSACFLAGDSRCNQMISLVALHTLFAREHNRIADELQKLNSHWSDELVFLEARRIMVAELQHIVYSQWLPEVIGFRAMTEFNLNVDRPGYSTHYDPKVDPAITNEFTTAALRFGHSIVDGKMKVYGQNKMEEILDIPEVMFYPSRMRKRDFFDQILTTLVVESPQIADTSVTEALTQYMFRAGNPFGMDLIAINIQRGRDHGLRPYNDYRELVGLPRYNHFEDFGHEASAVLQKIYASPEDVDLYVGGLMETRATGSLVGPTFRDIIADQFARLRKGDKYFYDLHPSISAGHFNTVQLQELKKSSLARIICDNSDGILLTYQPKNPFRKTGLSGNELISCTSPQIPKLNLIHWQERF
ncbi:Peroxinectin-like [Carabus blaptoides fortunei]